MNQKGFRATAWGLALGLAAWPARRAPPAPRDEGGERQARSMKQRVVIVDKDGKQKVYEGDGPMMRRGYLGVGLTDLTPELRAHFGVPGGFGRHGLKVEAGSPAEKAGIKVGDILPRIDGKRHQVELGRAGKVRELDDGQQIPIEVWRNGKAQNVTAAIVERERPELDMGPFFFKEGGTASSFMFKDECPSEWKGMAEEFKVRRLGGEGRPDPPHLVSPREAELEKKLKELEKRIDELERQLEKQR